MIDWNNQENLNKIAENAAEAAYIYLGFNPLRVLDNMQMFSANYFDRYEIPNNMGGNPNVIVMRDSGTHSAILVNTEKSLYRVPNKKTKWGVSSAPVHVLHGFNPAAPYWSVNELDLYKKDADQGYEEFKKHFRSGKK
jgi:hypothetical protein